MNLAILFPIIVFIAGAMTSFQPLVNAKLSQHMTSPIWASFVSFGVGTVLLFIVAVMVTGKFITFETAGLKWWMFSGGIMGAVFVTVAIYAVPYLGVAVLVALLIAGQLMASALLDHFGVLSETANPINWQKICGMTLLAIGAIITLKS